MKKFEQILKEKAHLNKIKNAKKTVPATGKASTLKLASSKVNDQAQLLLQLYENKSYESIPVYKLLRTANLQQYAKGFILRGYGINLGKLALLTEEEKTKFFQDLKVLPGHTIKLQKIIKAIAKESYQDIIDAQQLSDNGSDKKSSVKQKTIYSNISKKRTLDEDKEYSRQLQRVFNEYTPQSAEKKIIKSTKLQKRSTISSTNPIQQIKQSVKRIKNLPPRPLVKQSSDSYSTNVDFRKKGNDPLAKTTVRRSIGQPINNQKQIKSGAKKIQTSFNSKKQQSARQTLNRLLQGVTSGSVMESKKVMEIDLQIGKIKDLYRSFDGAVMSSTIANLDVEELVYAFAGYVGGRVIPAQEPPKPESSQYELNLKNLNFYPNKNEGGRFDSQQPIEDEIGEILRESYMHPLYREAQVTQQIQCGDEVASQGSQNEDYVEQSDHTGNEFNSNNPSTDNPMIESSFLGTQSYNFGLDTPLEIFNEPEPTDIDYFKPTVDSIFNFIKNIVLSAKMEREIPVMASSYLDAFLEKSKVSLNSLNYKRYNSTYFRLLVTCLLLASKIWDDESFQTPSFSKTFPEYSTVLLNEMQKQILKFLDYKLKLDKREYALTYFKLRKYIKKNIKSYQNRKLNIKLIRELQNGVKNDYRTSFLTKRNSF